MCFIILSSPPEITIIDAKIESYVLWVEIQENLKVDAHKLKLLVSIWVLLFPKHRSMELGF